MNAEEAENILKASINFDFDSRSVEAWEYLLKAVSIYEKMMQYSEIAEGFIEKV